MKTTLSIIIVNYHSLSQLKACLSSISKKINCLDYYEVIVVNNDSNKIDSLFKYPFLKIIEINKNIGFGAACNIGAKKATGKYLCFLNPDTEILFSNIKELLNNFDTKPSLGILGPQLLASNGLPQPWSSGKEITLWSILKNNFFPQKNTRHEYFFDVDWISGAAFFIKKELFEKLTGFDENFFMYFEDIDLCKRVRKNSLKICVYPQFRVMHSGGSSFTSKKLQKKHYYESQDLYFLKHFGKFHFLLLRLLRFFH